MAIKLLNKCLLVAVILFCFCLTPIHAYTVLWDTSHGTPDASYIPSASTGQWRYLVQTLNTNNFNITTVSDGYTAGNLATADIAVISNTTTVSSPFTPTQIDDITDFVDNGGGLLIMADTSGTPSYYESIANAFGVSFASPIADPFYVTTSNFSDHPVFTGIQEIFMAYSLELVDEGSSTPIAWTPDGQHILATSSTYGQGRVIVLGDSNLWRANGIDDFHKSDNPDFVISTFEHLVDADYVPEPATLLLMAMGSCFLMRKRKS